jgi:Fe2+ or Zn2+ uptake regulation protein
MIKRFSKKREDIRILLEEKDGALTAAAIHSALPHIDLVTIYRNLELFVSEGIIKKLHLDGSEATFEFQAHPHHHAVCSECERVVHFSVPEELLKSSMNIPDFEVTAIDLVVRGKCKHGHP